MRSLERAGALAASGRTAPVRAPRGTRDPDARDRYDRALGILRTLDTVRYDRARDLLVEALARDPGFARAHHLLALDTALGARVSNTEAAGVNPYFAALRADTRWAAFARRHRLPSTGPDR